MSSLLLIQRVLPKVIRLTSKPPPQKNIGCPDPNKYIYICCRVQGRERFNREFKDVYIQYDLFLQMFL